MSFQATKIEWCTHTWNPVTGCLHDCSYCYARGIARRFAGCYDPKSDENIKQHETGILHLEHTGRLFYKTKAGNIVKAPYPFGFAPTFHSYRLNDPEQHKRPAIVFVGSMCDLFGDWVPDEWIAEVFASCRNAPQHNYLFLTKNPDRLPLSAYLFKGIFTKHDDNCWFGTTITKQADLNAHYKRMTNIQGNTFLSIEPLHGPIDLTRIDTGDVIYNMAKGMGYYLGGGQKVQNPRWIILGAETGNRKGKIVPERAWVGDICEAADQAGIPVLMKESLLPIMGEAGMRRERPAELRR